MSLWTILTRVRDPLGELPTADERKLRGQYEAARQRVQTLANAFRSGSDVELQLKHAKQELSDVLQELPRGHTRGFMALCLWFAGTLTPLVVWFTELQVQLFFVEMWHSPDHWYLQKYRPFSALVWQGWQMLVSSPWSVVIPIFMLALVWAIQRRLLRWHALAFIRMVAALDALFIVLVLSALGHLLSLPLG